MTLNSLENFFHTLRQVLSGRQLIDNTHKYRIICLITALIHLIFCICMGVMHVDILCYYNIAIVYLYCFMGIVLSRRKCFQVIMLIFFIEVEFHSSLATILLGHDWEFMLYTVSLVPAAFYLANSLTNRDKHVIYAMGLSAFVIIIFFTIHVAGDQLDPLVDTSAYQSIYIQIKYFNMFIAVMLQFSFALLFALEAKYMEQLLEKENIKLGLEASYDPLTKLLNRRSMTRYMTEETERARGESTRFCLVMLDIDDFKQVNDSYGHDIGDKVLSALADIITSEIREGDYACRWGGEEFLLFVHGDKQETYFVADRIRRKLEETVLKNKYDNNFTVTATFGISEYRSYMPLRTIIDEADEKLYYGKNHGKNQVVV